MADIGPSDQVRDSIEKNKDRRSDDNVDYVEASLSSVRIPAGPTETDVRKVCLWMMIMSAVIIAVMLVISHLEESNVVNNGKPSQSVAGWVAVVGAAIVFGSTGVPMKSPALASLKIDSFVFALYTSLGIFFVSVPLIIYLFVIEEFQFRPWAVLGAADIVIIGYLAFMAVQMLGYCKAPAIWAGVGMTCAFLWGALAFKEPINNVPMAISAIFMLVIGVYAVSTSQGNVEKESRGVGDINESIERMDKEIDEGEAVKDEREIDGQINLVGTKRDSCKIFEEESKNMEIGNMLVDAREADAYTVQINPLRANDSQQGDIHHMKKLTLIDDGSIDGLSLQEDNIRNNSCNDKNIKKEKSSFQYLKEYSGAYFLCISVGFCDGALLVPFKLSSYGTTDSDGILEVFRYLASFGISSILVSPILFFFYCLFINQRRVPCFYFRTAFLPGVSSGVLWAAANFLSVHATYYLGIKIGFPLTQTCVLVAAVWGVAYFKEINLRGSGYLCRFSMGIFVILGGAYMLGSSG